MKKVLLFGILGALGCFIGAGLGEPVYRTLYWWATQFDPKIRPILQPQPPVEPKPTLGGARPVAANPLPPPRPPAIKAPAPRAPAPIDPETRRRLDKANAGTGPVQVTLEWANANDIDLHVIEPSGEDIYWENKKSRTGGALDVDMNASLPYDEDHPVEHVNYKVEPTEGRYRVGVIFYNQHVSGRTDYRVTVVCNGEPAKYYRGSFTTNDMGAVHQVCTFDVTRPQPEPQVTLSAPAEVQVGAGDENKFDVNIARGGFDGPVTLTLFDAGDGVTIESSMIPGGATSGRVVLRARDGARGGNRRARLLAKSNVDGRNVESTAPFSIEVLPPKIDAVLKLSLPEKVQVYRGGENTFTVKVGRFDFPSPAPVRLRLTSDGGGIASQPEVAIAPVELTPEQTSVLLHVTASAGAAATGRTVKISAAADLAGRTLQGDQTMMVEVVALPPPPPLWPPAVVTGAWTTLLALGLSLALTMGQNRKLGKPWLLPLQAVKLVSGSVLAGALAGGGGQMLSDISKRSQMGSFALPPAVGQVAGWILLGLLLGWILAGYIPNLSRSRAALAGGIGGVVGVSALLWLSASRDPTTGRIAGAAILGFAIGSMVALALVTGVREAWLEVLFGPNEKEIVNLGALPITFGSDYRKCTVCARGAAPEAFRYELTSGGIVCTDVVARKTAPVALDSSRQIGSVTVTARGIPTQSAVPAGQFSLRLSTGKVIPLPDGRELTASDLAGLQPKTGKAVAVVVRPPQNPAIVAFQNLSTQVWTAALAGGAPGQVEPGQKVQLVAGCTFNFGRVQAVVQ